MKTSRIALCVAFIALSACANPQANSATTNQATTSTPNPATTPPAQMPYPPYPQVPQHYTQGLPSNITQTIQQMYPGAFIVDVDFEGYGYEIELNNHMELFFDTNGKLLGQKWDD